MTTHRHIQIHNLQDTMSTLFHTCRKCAENAERIGNITAKRYYIRRAFRASKIVAKCRARLAV